MPLMHESPLLIDDQPAKLDDAHFERLSSLEEASLPISEAYSLLSPGKEINAAEKAAFFAAKQSGEVYQPDLRPNIDVEKVASLRAQLKTFKSELKIIERDVNASEQDRLVARVYRWKINEYMATLHMLAAADRMSSDAYKDVQTNILTASEDEEVRRVAQANLLRPERAFEVWNRFIYGNPSKETFRSSANWMIESTDPEDGDDEALTAAKAELKAVLISFQEEDEKYSPRFDTFEEVKKGRREVIEKALNGAHLPEAGPVLTEQGDELLRAALINIGLEDYERTASSDKSWSLSHANKALKGPASYKMVLRRFIGLPLGHEVLGHGLERSNGLRSALRLAGVGLDRYESGNEGKAVVAEQTAYDSYEDFEKITRWQDIVRRHFAISVAVGTDRGGEHRTFSETFDIVNAFDKVVALKARKEGETVEDAQQKANDKTWSLLVRACKGTNGGGAYLKDMVYLEGNIAIWKLADKYPDIIKLGDLAKIDISNPRHILVLILLGVLPESAYDALMAFDDEAVAQAKRVTQF